MLLSALLAIVSTSTLVAAAGTTGARCTVSALNWATNAEKQSPCLVAANLGAVCSSTGDYNIPALQAPVNQGLYTPSFQPTACECSTVVYNLAGACALCQGGTVATWFFWETNCTVAGVTIGFPEPIPVGTNVPNWAYLDTSSSEFNATTAQGVGDAPESSAILPTSTGPSSSPPIGTNPPSASGSTLPGSAPAESSPKKSSNTGAIAGGVVGGVLAVGLLGGLLFFFLRRSRNRQHATPMTQPFANDGQVQPGMIAAPYQHDSHSQHTTSQKPYDPNDPSTFPTSPGAQSMSFTAYEHPQTPPFVSNYSQPSFNVSTDKPNRTGGYSGVAEL